MEEHQKEFRKYIFWAAVIVMLILSYLIIRPFFVSIVSAFILAYIALPLHRRLSKKIPASLSALLSLLIIAVIIFIPLAILIGGITSQVYQALEEQSLSSLLDAASANPILQQTGIDLTELKERSLSYFASLFTSAVSMLPHFVLSLLIFILGFYYILLNWDLITSRLTEFIPFKDKSRITEEISRASQGIIYGTLLIATLEFIVGAIGFYFSGVKFYLMLPALIFFFAFIPGLGPIAVYGPTAIYYLAIGNYATAIGVLITGLIISFVIETLLLSKILGSRSNINPLVMILGVIGGISLFGIFGFIIGPLFLAYTIKLLQEGVSQKPS